jgi:hypothetical protein
MTFRHFLQAWFLVSLVSLAFALFYQPLWLTPVSDGRGLGLTFFHIFGLISYPLSFLE